MKIFLIGFMGCGKTHWGRLLSEKLQLPFFDLDQKIEEKEEKAITEIFKQDGEEYFRLLEKDVLYLLTENHSSFVMATGGGTPCFYNNIEYLKKEGTVIWLNCSVACLHSRLIKEKATRPLIRDLTDEGLRSFIAKKFADRRIFYRQAHITLKEEELSLQNLITEIFQNKEDA